MGSGVSKTQHEEVVLEKEQKEAELTKVKADHRRSLKQNKKVEGEKKDALEQLEKTGQTVEELKAELDDERQRAAALAAKLDEITATMAALEADKEREAQLTCGVLRGLTENRAGDGIPTVDEMLFTLLGPTMQAIAEGSAASDVSALESAADEMVPRGALPIEVTAVLNEVHARFAALDAQLRVAHTRLADQQHRAEESKETILLQQKQILTVENRNLKLRHEDPIKRLLKERQRRRSIGH
mmetsp:Transcript_20402/g.53042  ORF Transcript_20402/g.53042 Transcript_20402/m.53042 type:complete len:242 (+) Transcript_20402:252-977(+)